MFLLLALTVYLFNLEATQPYRMPLTECYSCTNDSFVRMEFAR